MESQSLTIARLSTLAAASPTTLSAIKLLDTLADYEAEVSLLFTSNAISGDAELISCFYASYLIALLLVGDLSVVRVWIASEQLLTSIVIRNEARFLTQRFPDPISDTDWTLVNSKKLLRALHSRSYPSVYQILQQSQWPDLLKPLVGRYHGMYRRRVLGKTTCCILNVRNPQSISRRRLLGSWVKPIHLSLLLRPAHILAPFQALSMAQ